MIGVVERSRRGSDDLRAIRILVVVNTTARRGAELEGVDLTHELNRIGYEARAVALAPGTVAAGIDVSVLGPSARHWKTLRSLRGAAREVDIVIAYGSATLPACAIALAGTSTPFIYRSIGDPGDWVRGEMHRWRTGLLFRRASFVVALWPKASDDIAALYSVSIDRIAVIPNARSEYRFQPATDDERARARSAWGVPAERAVVAVLGALAPEKQTDRAIQAMEQLPDAWMLVAGDGPERDHVDALVARLPARNVTVLGAVQEPISILHAADVLLLSSRTEGMPGAIIEAGLCGVPTVTPAVGTVREMIVDGVSGLVVSSTDAEVLADAVRTVLARRVEMGAAAREHMRVGYTWDAALARWTDVIATVLAHTSV